MADDNLKSTTPKPFIFVLMPFASSFNDIFEFGIKGAAQDVGAHAERLDDQIFTEGMLDHIFSEISKADVVIADMTGRNPNVFYEVGYAHALGKIVLLLTQDSNDIPFDLKHRQHTVYAGSIEKLRKDLAAKLEWAIAEATARKTASNRNVLDEGYFDVFINGKRVYPAPPNITGEVINAEIESTPEGYYWTLRIELRNVGEQISPPVEYVSLFCERSFPLKLVDIDAQIVSDKNVTDGLALEMMLGWNIPAIPKNGIHSHIVWFVEPTVRNIYIPEQQMCLRFSFGTRRFEYPFLFHPPTF